MNYEDNPQSIKYYVKKYILQNKEILADKLVVDFPAGSGITSRILKEIGSRPLPFDLFPEYFVSEGLDCQRANINEGIPLPNNHADVLICQEGIEHFTDQLLAFKNFNRVIKKDGILLITTPNYSNLKAKLSYMLAESEHYSMMAPNELDSIWMSNEEVSKEVYYGHIFLIGVQKLRILARLSGFKIHKIHFTRTRPTSAILLPFWYPWIWLSNYLTYKKHLRKNKEWDMATKKEVYGEIFRLAVNPKILVDGHLMIEFVKDKDVSEVAQHLISRHKNFQQTQT